MSAVTDPKRVIHVPRRFAPDFWGGTESVILHLCLLQQAYGFSPEILTSQALCPDAESDLKGIPVHRYPYVYPFFGLSKEDRYAMDLKGGNLLSLSLYRALRSLKDVRVIHAHVVGRTGGKAMTAARKLGVPFVLTMHGNFFDVPEDEKATLLAPNEGKMEWGKIFGALFKSRQVLEDADAVVCVGHSEFEYAKSNLPHDRIYYLPNSVQSETFQKGESAKARARLGIPEDAVVYGCISRIDPQKDQLTLIDAFGEVAHTREDVYLVLAGPVTDSDYERKVRKAIDQSEAKQRIHWLPAVAPESQEHVDLMAALDVFTLASRHEPFGIVTLEAWSAGKPVITTKAGGLAYLVDHEKDGFQVEVEDADELASRMMMLAENADLRTSFGEEGRRKVERDYSWEAAYQRQEDVYKKAKERDESLRKN